MRPTFDTYLMRRRELIALALSPLASGALQGALMGNIGAFFFALLFAYAGAALLGLPTLFILRWTGAKTLLQYLLAGTSAGAVCGLLLGWLMGGFDGFSSGSVFAGLFIVAAHGFIVALAYWLLAYWRTSVK